MLYFKVGEKFIKEEDEDFVQLLPCEEYDTVQSNSHVSVVKEHQLVEPSTSEDSCSNVNKEKTMDERSHSSYSERRLLSMEKTVGEVSDRSHNRKHQCDICGKKYRFPKDLKIHIMRNHTGEKPFSCSFCDKKFATNHQRKMHELHHKGLLPQCPVCGGRYVALQKHMLIHSVDSCKHTCTICKKSFHARYMKVHMLVHTGEKPYTCHDCGGRFRASGELKKHMAVHVKEKNRVCSACGKMFSDRSHLKNHISSHSDERPYHCETCGKAFKQKATLDIHQAVHSSEKRFVCSTCGKQFKRDGILQRHKMIHTGEQPYECSVCGMRFNQSSSMKRHMLVHTGEKPYSCVDCGERFTQSGGLASHRRRHCPINKASQN